MNEKTRGKGAKILKNKARDPKKKNPFPNRPNFSEAPAPSMKLFPLGAAGWAIANKPF